MKVKRLFLLSTLPFTLNCCTNNKPIKEAPFNLNIFIEEYNPPKITLLKSESEFNEFLNDEKIFTNEPSEEFKEINKKYDSNYFEKNDLAAVIKRASSSMIYGYSLNKISKEDNYWIISLNSLAEKENVSSDLGAYYCYYFELEKDPNILGAKVVFQ